MPVVDISPEDFWIWEIYRHKCILCNFPAVTLHECPPKSRSPKWRTLPETRWAVCDSCHRKLHEMNYKLAEKLLMEQRNLKFPDALERLTNGRP